MTNSEMQIIFEDLIKKSKNTLFEKAKEYASDTDRLHNFKQAGDLQQCTPVKALGGMMAKHTVSVYDLIEKYENGLLVSQDLWNEKIIDSINYLFLLKALLEEEQRQLEEVKYHCDYLER